MIDVLTKRYGNVLRNFDRQETEGEPPFYGPRGYVGATELHRCRACSGWGGCHEHGKCVPCSGTGWVFLMGKDACEECHGETGNVPGNENIVDGRVLCDDCHVRLHHRGNAPPRRGSEGGEER